MPITNAILTTLSFTILVSSVMSADCEDVIYISLVMHFGVIVFKLPINVTVMIST
jgi:hypothetical protein